MPYPRTSPPCPACATPCHFRHEARGGRSGDCYASRRLLLRNAHDPIWVCPSCGWGVVFPLPDEERLRERYRAAKEDAYLVDAGPRRLMFARELDHLTSLLGRPPRSLLDVGCSYGLMLEEARMRSIPALGVEPSDHAVAYCLSRGLRVRHGGLECLEATDSFEAVIMWDVLEHLVDPAFALRTVRAHLESSGILSLVVPRRDSTAARVLGERWWSVCALHLHYPTRRGMDYLLRLAGFSILETSTLPKVAHLSQLARWIPGSAVRRVVEGMLPGDRLITVDPRDQLLIRARVA